MLLELKSKWQCDSCDQELTEEGVIRPAGWRYVVLKMSCGYGSMDREFLICEICHGGVFCSYELLDQGKWLIKIKETFKRILWKPQKISKIKGDGK